MDKKRIIILSSILIVIIVGLYFYFSKAKQNSQEPTINKSEVLQVNAQTSKDASVLQIRKDLNLFLNGKITEESDPLLVNGDPKMDRKGFLLTGLKNFSNDYYKSKFVVLSTRQNPNGGEIVYIEFIDKPDKVFIAGVVPLSNSTYKLGFLGQNQQVTQERLQRLNAQYSFLLLDKAHAL